MANKVKLTPEQIEAIPRLYDNGLTEAEIADKFGVSAMTIHRYRNPEYYEKHKEKAKERQKTNLKEVQRTRAQNHKAYNLSFHKENDAAVVDKLAAVDNVQGYIRGLILDDIARDESNGDSSDK